MRPATRDYDEAPHDPRSLAVVAALSTRAGRSGSVLPDMSVGRRESRLRPRLGIPKRRRCTWHRDCTSVPELVPTIAAGAPRRLQLAIGGITGATMFRNALSSPRPIAPIAKGSKLTMPFPNGLCLVSLVIVIPPSAAGLAAARGAGPGGIGWEIGKCSRDLAGRRKIAGGTGIDAPELFFVNVLRPLSERIHGLEAHRAQVPTRSTRERVIRRMADHVEIP